MQPETPSERVALIVWYMAFGMAMSSKEIAKLTGMTRRSGERLMNRVSRVIPIYQDDHHIWRICPSNDTERHISMLR